MNNLRFIRDAIYALKQEFGLPVNIVWRSSSEIDLETGRKTVTQDSKTVNRAIVLPATTQRDFVYDLTFIASNKNFTYGGLFDKHRRKVFIDRQDLPPDFEIKLGYILIIAGKHYDVKGVDDYVDGFPDQPIAYELDVEQATNIDIGNVTNVAIYQDVFLKQAVEVTVE